MVILTLKFLGHIQGKSVMIFVDSSSSHSFVNEKLSFVFTRLSTLPTLVKVQDANGHIIPCSAELKQSR
jgi:hypothetical protein